VIFRASLVPVFNFGEVDTYDNKISPESSRTYKFQQTFRKWTGIAPCILNGRGPFGLLPRRVPVTTVGKLYFLLNIGRKKLN
jgi:hypothetical protein